METIYQIIETVLPFQWIGYDFMKNAFLAIIIIISIPPQTPAAQIVMKK